jgi:two-component system, NarL family, nitrate/nitrite response regulator NarL
MRQAAATILIGRRTLLREGIASLLLQSSYKIIATAERASHLGNVHVPPGRRTLIILGVDGANGNYEDTAADIRALRAAFADCKIVVIAEMNAPVDLQRVLSLAPDGFILNLGSREILLKSLELTLLDQQVFVLSQPTAPSLAADLPDFDQTDGSSMPGQHFSRSRNPARPDKAPPLSPREREILICLAEGRSNKAIARLCDITESTVKVHLKAILRKINAHNRTQAAIWAVAHGYRDAILEDSRVDQENQTVQHVERTASVMERETASIPLAAQHNGRAASGLEHESTDIPLAVHDGGPAA